MTPEQVARLAEVREMSKQELGNRAGVSPSDLIDVGVHKVIQWALGYVLGDE